MIVVADTSPLNYLVLIGEIELLPALYDKILIPQIVLAELQHPHAPAQVRAWAAVPPDWCEACAVDSAADATLTKLDDGERDAIFLALKYRVDTLLIDEADGRREAVRRHLQVLGTISILEKAAQRGWIDFRSALGKLDQTNFRLSRRLRMDFLTRNP